MVKCSNRNGSRSRTSPSMNRTKLTMKIWLGISSKPSSKTLPIKLIPCTSRHNNNSKTTRLEDSCRHTKSKFPSTWGKLSETLRQQVFTITRTNWLRATILAVHKTCMISKTSMKCRSCNTKSKGPRIQCKSWVNPSKYINSSFRDYRGILVFSKLSRLCSHTIKDKFTNNTRLEETIKFLCQHLVTTCNSTVVEGQWTVPRQRRTTASPKYLYCSSIRTSSRYNRRGVSITNRNLVPLTQLNRLLPVKLRFSICNKWIRSMISTIWFRVIISRRSNSMRRHQASLSIWTPSKVIHRIRSQQVGSRSWFHSIPLAKSMTHSKYLRDL